MIQPDTKDTPNNGENSASRMSLENRIRMKHNEIGQDEHRQEIYEADIVRIQNDIKHLDDAISRIGVEAKSFLQKSESEKAISQQAEAGELTKQQELNRKNEEAQILEHKLILIRKQAADKERELHVVKESLRKLIKEREDFHKQFEAESFGTKEDTVRAREKAVRLHQLEMEKSGKVAELTRREHEVADIKQDILRKHQDLDDFELQRKHLGQKFSL